MIPYELIEFTKTVFGYYNGRINPNIPAEILIYPTDSVPGVANDTEEVIGSLTYPNIVTVKLGSICRIYTGGIIKVVIIEVIIHELYHLEHLLRYSDYMGDEIYRDKVETIIDFMTTTYIVNHFHEISNTFQISYERTIYYYIERSKKYLNSINGSCYYERRTKSQHILKYLDHILSVYDKDAILDLQKELRIAQYLLEKEGNAEVYFIINDDRITLRNNEYYIHIEDFNELINQNKIYDIYANDINIQVSTFGKPVDRIDFSVKFEDIKYPIMAHVVSKDK